MSYNPGMTNEEMSETDNAEASGTAQFTDEPGLAGFEAALAELESIVATLESGEMTLEQSLSSFERGVVLTKQCQTMLKNAELRVDQLVGADGSAEPSSVESFDVDKPAHTPE